MPANCVICMQLQLLPLQNSNARFRPCSVKLNIELYYGRNCAPRCHILAKLKPYHDCNQALNVILHRCVVSMTANSVCEELICVLMSGGHRQPMG